MSKRLFLLDGMALLYRAHFAFIKNPIRTSDGVNTSALYGFTNTLLDILNNQRPTHLAVVLDTAAPTPRRPSTGSTRFRHPIGTGQHSRTRTVGRRSRCG